MLENCAADGFVKTGREGRLFHSGGRGIMMVRQDIFITIFIDKIYKKIIIFINIFIDLPGET